MKALDWILRLVPAAILGQTLFFKLTGAPESVWIFSTLGVEPWGRHATALAELVAVVLLLVPRTAWAGAALAVAVMAGAIASHLFILGISVAGDGGLLFGLACVTATTAAATLWRHRAEIPGLGTRTR